MLLLWALASDGYLRQSNHPLGDFLGALLVRTLHLLTLQPWKVKFGNFLDV